MRKLLLGTTALAAAATLSANVAVADVSISGYYEWKYQSTSSDITANDGTTFSSDSEIKFSFTNKTDSGLTLGLVTEMLADAFPGYKASILPSEMAKFIYKFSLEGNTFFNGKILPVSTTNP